MEFSRWAKERWFYPLLISFILHLFLVILAMVIRLPGWVEEKKEIYQTFHMKSVDMNPVAPRLQGSTPNRATMNSMQFVNDHAARQKSVKDIRVESLLENKTLVDSRETDGAARNQSELATGRSKELNALLFQTQEKQFREKVEPTPKAAPGVLAKLSEKIAQENTADNRNFVDLLKKSLQKITFQSPENLSIDPEEGMPGFTPSGRNPGRGLSNADLDQGVRESQSNFMKYEALDDFLDIAVFTYTDTPTGEKYYMIKIFTKKGVKVFRVMPKEILFTVDASLSISHDRLDEFKRGISYCLQHLNKDDKFNIIAFKDRVSFFAPQSVPATPESIKGAERFVSSLTSSQQTDVYAAFKSIVELPYTLAPSNVILISDGRPTHGVVDSRELINSVTRINHKKRPIFAFSGGAKVNRYLLDFTAYQNRAWSQFVKSIWDIHKGLGDFYDKIKDPLFLNLRYRMNNLNEKEIFPKSLPDFYRNAEFTLYGKYKDEDSFSMQLLGDVDGKTKELIFTRSLKDAQAGNAELMKGYAFNKIYYLISRLTEEGSDREILQEINALSSRYGITTPYSPDIQKKS